MLQIGWSDQEARAMRRLVLVGVVAMLAGSVVEGVVSMGMGSIADPDRLKVIPKGRSIIAPANMAHFASTTQGATLQISSRGPFQVTYVNREHDPRL
jgi:hypothetical protein